MNHLTQILPFQEKQFSALESSGGRSEPSADTTDSQRTESRLVRPMIRRLAAWVVLCVVLLAIPTLASGQSLSPKEKQAVKRIKSNLDRAGKQFQAKKFESSATYVLQTMELLDLLPSSPRKELIEAIKPEYERLAKAHALLTKEGQKLDPLTPLPEPMSDDPTLISFTKSVAPILVAKCGTCHVNRSRGNFSTATFTALIGSTTLAFGKPDDSRLIEVIVSGEMPKGGLKVEPAELKILRDWIQQGAKFDGDNENQNLNELAPNVVPAPRRQPPMTPVKPTGKETVSFGLHVAPVLIENCGRCHITRNARGNFSLANFRSLLAGGDGGAPIVPGKSSTSGLIRRLRGDNAEVMPPTGKLDDETINMIAKWIDEGAAYDGGDPQLEVQAVFATARAGAMSHDELTAERIETAAKTWTLVMDDVESVSVPSKNFLVTGSTNESRLTDVSLMCEKMTPKIAKALRANTKTPLVKGNITIFVFDKRYDFSEFGKMVEQRDFPKSISAHWGFSTVNAYATVLMTRNQVPEDVEVALAQQIAAIHVAGLAPDVPRWFADGIGLWTVKKVFSRNDSLKQLDADADSAAAQMLKRDDFAQNRMPSDRAALVGYLFIKRLRSQASSYNKLMKLMASGESFEKSFQSVYGMTPVQLINQ